VVLERNPNYGGTRPAPLREIDIDLDVDATKAVADVRKGDADYVLQVPGGATTALARRYGPDSAAARAGRQRFFSATTPNLHFLSLNALRPLFADERARVAVTTAIDRSAMARRLPVPITGGLGFPTDQITPPGLPGFRERAILGLTGPDARSLHRLTMRPRRRATMITCSFPICREIGRQVTRDLARIGIDVHVRAVPLGRLWPITHDPHKAWDIGYGNYFMDYPDPASYVGAFFGAGKQAPGGYHDAAITRRLTEAERLRGEARGRAIAAIDADLVRAGGLVPFATNATSDFFSARMGCQVQQPIYGMSLASLCVQT
jgi:ABC-type oligopeptide transport system substrate-binding subunit